MSKLVNTTDWQQLQKIVNKYYINNPVVIMRCDPTNDKSREQGILKSTSTPLWPANVLNENNFKPI